MREGSPRVGAVVFENFCLDGTSFGSDENSYVNGKTGILIETDNDACRVRDMGMVYLEHALIVRGADALDVSGNFLTECGSCVELLGAGQATRVCDNHFGAGPYGYSLFAENHNGLLISGNNIFPRGIDSVHLRDCFRTNVSSNRMHSFYPGMITLEGTCKENLISSNMFERQVEGFPPFIDVSNGLDDDFGVVQVNGDGNTVVANHVTLIIPPERLHPAGVVPTVFRIRRGDQNVVGGEPCRLEPGAHDCLPGRGDDELARLRLGSGEPVPQRLRELRVPSDAVGLAGRGETDQRSARSEPYEHGTHDQGRSRRPDLPARPLDRRHRHKPGRADQRTEQPRQRSRRRLALPASPGAPSRISARASAPGAACGTDPGAWTRLTRMSGAGLPPPETDTVPRCSPAPTSIQHPTGETPHRAT